MKPKKLPSGNWRVRVLDYVEPNGKRHLKSFTAPSKNEAVLKALEWEKNRPSATYDELTLEQAYKRYIDSKAATLSPSTVKTYRGYERRDFPLLKKMKLKDITAELVQTAISEISNKYAPKTVRNKHGLLFEVLKAYRPSLQLTTHLPQAEIKDKVIPTSDDVRMCLDNANEFIRVPILLASSGSLRCSEICALTPEDFSELGVQVNKAVVFDDEHNLALKLPKSNAGHRFCPLPADVIKEARAWEHFGLTPDKLEKQYQRLKKKLGLEFTFHSFRHYFASELHAQGVPDKYIAKVGGWKDVSTLQKVYQHTLHNREAVYEDKIVNIFATELKVIKGKKEKKQA